MNKYLEQIPERQLHLIGIAVFILTILASHLYLFKVPYKAYSGLKDDRAFLQSKVATGSNLDGEIQTLQGQVDVLTESLHGTGSYIPANKLLARNIEKLDRVSNNYAVTLQSVKPANSNALELFEEVPLSIRVAGSYYNLYTWLHEVEIELGPMVVKQFEIMQGTKEKELVMKLKMVSYLPIQTN